MFLTSMQRILFVLTLVLALTLPFALLLFSGKAGTPEEEFTAREAVFRYQLTHNEFMLNDGVDIVCVEITNASGAFASSGSDPPRGMIARLNDGRHKVRQGSDCDYNGGNGVVEKGSNNRAFVLRTGEISWKSRTRVAVTGGYYYASEGGSRNVYHLEKRDGKWLVVEDILISIS